MSSRACICTVISRSYLPFAQAWLESIRRHHPAGELDVLVSVVDGTPANAPAGSIGVDFAQLPGATQMLEGYGRQALVIAGKAPLLQHALELGYERAVFLDVDMLAYDRLDPLLDRDLAQIVLTPHVLAPLANGAFTTGDTGPEFERILLLSGVFNGGCIAVGPGASSSAFLDWFADRLRTHCRHDVTNGLHYDQTWLDFVPGMFDSVQILRDPSINVAYWNVHERPVTQAADGRWMAGDTPLRLFHFSGFDADRPTIPSRYRAAMTMHDMAGAAPLFADYASRLAAAHAAPSPSNPATTSASSSGSGTR